VPWQAEKSVAKLITQLKKEGVKIIAIEQSPQAVSIRDIKKILRKNKIALIFGNETKGLPLKILKMADLIAEIPMRGRKESLNVSMAAAITLYATLHI